MASTLLRDRESGHRAEVTSVEQFFDLVFVIAVTQVSLALVDATRNQKVATWAPAGSSRV